MPNFFASLTGASLVSAVAPALFRPLVPIMLTLVLLYVLRHKDLGTRHAPIVFSRARAYLALTAISAIGMYDGFFGPGTGSFLMLLFIRLYGFDFLHASAGARTINVATNAGALLFFGIHGEIHWGRGLRWGSAMPPAACSESIRRSGTAANSCASCSSSSSLH